MNRAVAIVLGLAISLGLTSCSFNGSEGSSSSPRATASGLGDGTGGSGQDPMADLRQSVHPRLLFTPEDLPRLRVKMTDGGPDDSAFSRIVADAIYHQGADANGISLGSQFDRRDFIDFGLAYRLSDPADSRRPGWQAACKARLAYAAQHYGPDVNDPHYSSMRLSALAIGFDLCFDTLAAGDTAPPDRQLIIDEILSYLDPAIGASFAWMNRSYPPYTSNGAVLLGAALGLSAIVLRGETTQEAWLDDALLRAETIIDVNLASIFDPDGSANEGELYGPFAMYYLIPYIEARVRYDGVDLALRPEIRNFDRWLPYTLLPKTGGYTLQSNDGNYTAKAMGAWPTYQSWAQDRYGSQLSRYVHDRLNVVGGDDLAEALWQQGLATVSPEGLLPDSMLFRGRGFYTYRTGWPAIGATDSRDTLFTFYAGEFGGGHAQEDQGAFSLYSKRAWFLRESGYSTAARQSEAHNLVFIDGLGEHSAGSSVGTDGHMVAWNIGPFADYLQADLKDAYGTHSPLNNQDYPFPLTDWTWGINGANPVDHARRHVWSVKEGSATSEYFVIFDDIQKDAGPHRYDWTLHTELNFTLDTSAHPLLKIQSDVGSRLNVFFAYPPAANVTLSNAVYDLDSADPDLRRILATTSNTINPNFFVVLHPTDGQTIPATYTVPAGVVDALAAQIAWPTATDRIYFNRSSMFSDGSLASDAQMLLIRRNSAGTVTDFSMAEGTLVVSNGILLASADGASSVTSDGVEISVSNPSMTYHVYGPNVVRVTWNRIPLPFTRTGSYIDINRPTGLDLSGVTQKPRPAFTDVR